MLTPRTFSPPKQGSNSPTMMNRQSPESTNGGSMDMEIDSIPKIDPLQKLQQQELIPELFAILHDLQIGKLLAKDFDNKLGSIRLGLGNMKQYLREIPGITETVEAREQKIEQLKVNNYKKEELIEEFRAQVGEK